MRRLLIVSISLLLPALGFSKALNTWVEMTGDKTLMMTPSLSGGIDPISAQWCFLFSFGINDFIDLNVTTAGEALFRVDLSHGASYAIAGLYIDRTDAAIHFNGVYPVGKMFGIELNLSGKTSYTNSIGDWVVGGAIAPYLSITPDFSIFLEFDIYNTLTTGVWEYTAIPGVAFGLGDGEVSLSMTVGTSSETNALTFGYGLWYSISYDFSE